MYNNRDLGKIVLNCKITFDGSNNLSADSFLTKIEDRRRLTQVTDDEMLLSLPVLLDGLALKWFKINEKNFYSWQKFKKEFKSHFGDDDFDRRIREQIHTRTQGKNERINEYLTNIQGLINRLDNEIPVFEQLDWTHRGLRPEYHRVIRRSYFKSFRELSQLGRSWEKEWNVYIKDYKPPPPPESSFLQEFAYQHSSASSSGKKTSSAAVKENNIKVAALDSKSPEGNPKTARKGDKKRAGVNSFTTPGRF